MRDLANNALLCDGNGPEKGTLVLRHNVGKSAFARIRMLGHRLDIPRFQ